MSGQQLLKDLESFIAKYVVLPQGLSFIIALWVMATWAIEIWNQFPNLAITSGRHRCGKSTLLEVLSLICRRPYYCASPSPATLYRIINPANLPTLLIDESQNLMRKGSENAMVATDILCAANSPNVSIPRCGGPDNEVQWFSPFCAKALGLIGSLPKPLADRCLDIRMVRRARTDKVARFNSRKAEPHGRELASKLKRWTADNLAALQEAYDQREPLDLENFRLAQMGLSLQTVVAAADSRRLGKLESWIRDVDDKGQEDEGLEFKVLAAVRTMLAAESRRFFPSQELCDWLNGQDSKPWSGESPSKSNISMKKLGTLLREFDVQSGHSADKSKRGYRRTDLERACYRYLEPIRPDASKRPQ